MEIKTDNIHNSHKGCIVSKNILSGNALRWCVREEPNNPLDSGWIFMSEVDTDEFLDDPSNCTIALFDVVARIEPAIELIRDFPIGTDLMLIKEDGESHFYDNVTGLKVF